MEFIHDDFLLHSERARRLYHDYAASEPILDYHSHLPAAEIAQDRRFRDLSEIWLEGDHYKWRVMRANGVSEYYCTGEAAPYDKFLAWARTVPYTLRNPLYHWTHLELKRYFGIDDILNPSTAKKIYQECGAKLQTKEYSVRNLLRKMNVKVVCTTDDPTDTLEYHRKVKADGFEIRILPAFRPDKAMNADDSKAFNQYVSKLEAVSNVSISSYKTYLDALKLRHDYFASMDCSVSDHGLEQVYAEDYTQQEVNAIFDKLRSGKEVSRDERVKFKSAMLFEFALWDWEKGWVQQYHLGALRNNK